LSIRELGELGGETTVTLLTTQIPSHSHVAQNGAVSNLSVPGPTAIFGGGGRGKQPAYGPAGTPLTMSASAVGVSGGGQPHNNMSPYLTLNFVIALQGVFPARS